MRARGPLRGAALLLSGLVLPGLLLPAAATAAGPEVWGAMHDARLSESADRDAAAALAIFETLIDHLSEDDPLRGEMLVDLARARFDEGDLEGARRALVLATGDPRVSLRARSWRVQLEAWDRRVRSLPTNPDFSTTTGPWVLGWSAAAEAGLSPSPGGLAWRTFVRDGRDDYLLAAIDVDKPLTEVVMDVRADAFPAHLRLIVEDRSGQRWTAPVATVPPGTSLGLAFAVRDLLPAGLTASDRRIDPNSVAVVMLQDVTAFHSGDRGANVVTLETLQLR